MSVEIVLLVPASLLSLTDIISTRAAVTLQPGTRLGPYEVLSALGVGGMGEVYRARDTRLDRVVTAELPASPHWAKLARMMNLSELTA